MCKKSPNQITQIHNILMKLFKNCNKFFSLRNFFLWQDNYKLKKSINFFSDLVFLKISMKIKRGLAI